MASKKRTRTSFRPPAAAAAAPASPWPARLLALALVIVTVAVFVQVRAHEFIDFDDGLYIVENPHVRTGLSAENVGWAFTTGHAANWHPLTWLSHQLDASLFGLDAGSHHVVSLGWHVVNVLCLFGLMRSLTGSTWKSAFVSALFAVHPAHVESVAWVAERKDVLSTFFWLTSTWAWVTWVRRPTAVRFGVSLGLFALGLMSKPMLITLPFTLLLLDIWPLKRTVPWRRRIIEKLPFFGLAAASSAVTFGVQRQGGAVSSVQMVTVAERIANACVAGATYLRELLWPAKLAAFYPFDRHLPLSTVLLSAALLVAVSVAVWAWRRAHPYFLVGWLWFLGTMVPVIGLVQIGMQSHADRYTYVPFIGLFIMIVWGLQAVGTRFGIPCRVFDVTGGIGILALAFVAHAQAATWRTSETLWTHAVTVAPDNAKAHNSLGAIYGNTGRVREAEAQFKEALRLHPDKVEGVHILPNLARSLMAQGKIAEALPYLEQARQLKPQDADVLNQLGSAYLSANRWEDAASAWRDAVRADPQREDVWFALGITLAANGRLAEARQAFTEVLRINPGRKDAAFALSRLR